MPDSNIELVKGLLLAVDRADLQTALGMEALDLQR
jgi:hypothetical protein